MVPTFFLALLASAGALAVFWAIRPVLFSTRQPTAVDERMAYYGTDVNFTDDVARLSFRERMIQPAVERLSAAVAQLTPQDYMRRLEHRLEESGRPSGLGAVGFIALRVAATLVAASLGLAVGAFVGSPLSGLIAGGILGALAWIGMSFWLSSLVGARRHEVELALPNLIDFLVIAVSAGLTVDRALTRVVAQYDNALTRGLAVALGEVQLGRPRLEALDAYGRATGVPAVHAFIQAIIGSEKMGVPMAEVLRVQSESARQRRGDRAAQLGGSASIKMTIPMVLFIFPTIWLVLLGPALFVVFQRGL
ncbi:MAG TPA: type II secretion system F family protein [Candidatus Dormibacteraeota bacterium]